MNTDKGKQKDKSVSSSSHALHFSYGTKYVCIASFFFFKCGIFEKGV